MLTTPIPATRSMMTGISEVRRHAPAIVVFILLLGGFATGAPADTGTAAFGVPATEADVAAHNTMVFPDGSGLPPGRGTVGSGRMLYQNHCLVCHGPEGRGGPGGELAGGTEPLTSDTPDQTIGSYWPFPTTLFDFIRRSMPLNAPGTLTNNEVYSLSAYLLALNGILAEDASLDAAALAAIVMPNRDGFLWIDAAQP